MGHAAQAVGVEVRVGLTCGVSVGRVLVRVGWGEAIQSGVDVKKGLVTVGRITGPAVDLPPPTNCQTPIPTRKIPARPRLANKMIPPVFFAGIPIPGSG